MDTHLFLYPSVEIKEMFDHLGWVNIILKKKETCKILFSLWVGIWLWGILWVIMGSMEAYPYVSGSSLQLIYDI